PWEVRTAPRLVYKLPKYSLHMSSGRAKVRSRARRSASAATARPNPRKPSLPSLHPSPNRRKNPVHPQVTAGTALLIGELAAINARFNVAAALAAKFATAKPVCRFAYHGGKLDAGYVAKHQHLMARAERAERVQLLPEPLRNARTSVRRPRLDNVPSRMCIRSFRA